ncbi:MAG: calcium/sodium antiporter [Bacteroidales bacterium]|nr:calcium/sodium antiporter [Bacteroidales bacterium]
MDILLLIAGLALILLGANYLVDGASTIAKRFGISNFVIGMTIVGIGTSTPEMVVSFLSAAQGNADIAVGNVMGSNIFNILMILGITALISPLPLTSNNIKKDIPFSLLAVSTLLFAGSDMFLDGASANIISRTDGLMLLALFGVFMAYTIYSSQSASVTGVQNQSQELTQELTQEPTQEPTQELSPAQKPIWLSVIMVIGGLAGLVFGGDLFVAAASSIAKMLGVSDAVIAVTIMAGGTSLPELASCVVAAMKKNTDLALGNVIGSNVSNIFMILGGSAVIHPLGMSNIGLFDMGTLLLASIFLFFTAFTFKKRSLDRIEGALFILIYIGYIVITITK